MIKLSQFILEEIITRGRTTITKDKGDPEDIYPVLDVTHVMRGDTTPKIVTKTKFLQQEDSQEKTSCSHH